jgi:type II secretory pathway component PulC
MMAYFNEIKVRPERIGAVFDTLAPVWYTDENDGKQKIEGYRVEICGEEDFFKAVGFKEGDIVREVNGIRMTNRYAAEELIRRFVYGDLHFAHIKMERDGEDILQTYDVEE